MNQFGILSIHCFRTAEAHLLNIEEMRQFAKKNKKTAAYSFIDESITQSMRKKYFAHISAKSNSRNDTVQNAAWDHTAE